MFGRVEEAVRYSDAGQTVVSTQRRRGAIGFRGLAWRCVCQAGDRPARTMVEWYAPSLHAVTTPTQSPGHALVVGTDDRRFAMTEAMAAADGLIDAAEATLNPWALSFALLAYGFAFRDADPVRARDALRRGLVIAQDSGNRYNETSLRECPWPASRPTRRPAGRARLPHSGHPQHHDSGNITRDACTAGCPGDVSPPARTRTNQPPLSPVSQSIPIPQRGSPRSAQAIAHLRDVLGDQTYESLARKGETMTTAEMVTYAYDQIDQARAELNAVSE